MRGIGIAKSLAALWRDRRGNTLPIFAASLVPLLAVVGGGVDASRGYLTKTQLQNACDAGVLAGRRAMANTGVFETSEKATASRMFNANFDSAIVDAEEVTFDTRAGDEGEVFGAATTTIPTVLMQFFGTEELSFSVGCMAELQIANTDIMFVLDTTGSMGGSRIIGLRDAVRDFHETIASSITDADVRVRYGFVPYSTTVNASELLKDSDDLLQAGDLSYDDFRDTALYQTRVAVFDVYDYVVREKVPLGSGSDEGEWWDCNDSWEESSGTKPNDVTVTFFKEHAEGYFDCRRTWETFRYEYDENHKAYHYRWVYRPRELDTSSFKAFESVSIATGLDQRLAYLESKPERGFTVQELATLAIRDRNTSGYKWMTTASYTWNGCLQERDTIQTDDFDPVPEEAYDLDIDRVPSSEATRWSPIWPAVSYRRAPDTEWANEGTKTTSTPCPSPMLPFKTIDLSSETTAVPGWLDEYLEDLQPTGNTYHDIGMIWGARLGSADGVVSGNVTAGELDDVERHLIFMTDGHMEPHIQSFTAYGVEWNDNRIAPAEASTGTVAARHTQRFLVACDAAKAEGYTVWVIGFGAKPTDEMKKCATGDRALYSNNTDKLRETFRFIASQVADLRLAE